MRPRRLLASFFLAAALVEGANAHAQPVPGQEIAKKLFDEGLEAEKQKDWSTALAKFNESQQIKMTSGNRFHKAYCLEMSGKLAAALDEYEAAEKLAQTEKKAEVLAAIKARYEPLIKRVPSVAVKTASIPNGSKFALDGVEIAPVLLDGRPFRVDPGDHAVTARAPGYETFAKNFTLAEGTTTTTVEVILEKSTPIAPTNPTPGENGPITEPPSEQPASRSKTIPILTSAGAVVLLGTGIFAFVAAGSAQSDAEKDCPTKISCDSEQSKVRTLDALALGAFIGGAGLGALSVILWTSSPGKSASLKARPSWIGIEGAF